MNTKKAAVQVENLKLGYENKVICENVDFETKEGEITCLMGKNGAGKSTLLKTLSGLIPDKGGNIYLFGKPFKEYKRNELSKIMAVVLTQRIAVEYMTVMEVTCMGRYPHTGFMGRINDTDRQIAYESLKQVRAEKLADRSFSTLSDGEKQKVLIARAVTQEPRILLLDEPTTHLDIRHKLEIMNLLNKLAKEKKMSVILSLHEPDLAVKACHHVISLKDGLIIFDGAPENMKKKDIINHLYDMEPNRFSYATGSTELRTGASNKIFVISCGGKGIETYRILAKNRKGFSTGLLTESDTDYHIALSMGANIFSIKPFEQAGEYVKKKAIEAIKAAELIIDTNFPVNELTKENCELITQAINKDKKILSLRNPEEFKRLFGDNTVHFINDENLLHEYI